MKSNLLNNCILCHEFYAADKICNICKIEEAGKIIACAINNNHIIAYDLKEKEINLIREKTELKIVIIPPSALRRWINRYNEDYQ